MHWLLACARCASCDPPVPAALDVGSAAPVSTGAFALGINEAVAIPMVRRSGAPTARDRELLDADARRAAELGARLVRGHSGNYPRSSWLAWTTMPEIAQGETDAWLQAIQAHGLEPVLMLSPWPGNQTANHTSTYLPDLAAYGAWVQQVVERYDADGVDDMPGLAAPIRYFEVDNEPDLKNTNIPRGGDPRFDPSRFCLPEEYAQVLVTTAAAVRAASPEAQVLGGGFYRPHADGTAAYMDRLFAVEGVAAAIDILSLHTYGGADAGPLLARGIAAGRQRLPDKPVWVTETSAGSEELGAEGQAAMVVTLSAWAAMAGAERLFWHTIADPPPRGGGPGGFRTHSLLATSPEGRISRKPAADVYQALAGVLREHDLVGAVADGEGAVRLRDGSVLLYAGSRAATAGVDLRHGGPLSGTATAPAWIAP